MKWHVKLSLLQMFSAWFPLLKFPAHFPSSLPDGFSRNQAAGPGNVDGHCTAHALNTLSLNASLCFSFSFKVVLPQRGWKRHRWIPGRPFIYQDRGLLQMKHYALMHLPVRFPDSHARHTSPREASPSTAAAGGQGGARSGEVFAPVCITVLGVRWRHQADRPR